MKMEIATQQRIARNAILSLFIYVLPIALMFLTFYFTGQRPWENRQAKETVKSITKQNNLNNGSND